MACSYLTLALFLPVQSDVVNSKLIRNLMQLLVNTVLERAVASYEAFSAPLPPLVSAPGAGGGGTRERMTGWAVQRQARRAPGERLSPAAPGTRPPAQHTGDSCCSTRGAPGA